MRKIVFLAVISAVILSCQKTKQKTSEVQERPVEIVTNREDISQCESIIRDSAFMDVKGDTAWHQVNKHTIEIKIGKNCYLRKENADGVVISVKYHYNY